MVATILVSASCSKLLTLSVSSSVDDLLWVDSLSELSEPPSSGSNSLGIEDFVSSASEVLGLWKCIFRLLRYLHSGYRVSHLICLPL